MLDWPQVMTIWNLSCADTTTQIFLDANRNVVGSSDEEILVQLEHIQVVTSALVMSSLNSLKAFIDPIFSFRVEHYHQTVPHAGFGNKEVRKTHRYILFPTECKNAEPWKIMVFDATMAQRCLATTPGTTSPNLARFLVLEGARFSTVKLFLDLSEVKMETSEVLAKREIASFNSEMAWRERKWLSSPQEFLKWLEGVHLWCLKSGRVRAALLCGGFI
jgi:hypothetical protein